jgi:hypothetical protein
MKTSGAVGRAERRVDERYFRRTAEADFAPPLVRQEYSYLVPAGSSIRSIADLDRPGVRVAVLRNYASTVTLSRLMKQAETIYAETPIPTFELLRTGKGRCHGIRPLPARGGVAKGPVRPAHLCERVYRRGQSIRVAEGAIESSGMRGVEVAS